MYPDSKINDPRSEIFRRSASKFLRISDTGATAILEYLGEGA